MQMGTVDVVEDFLSVYIGEFRCYSWGIVAGKIGLYNYELEAPRNVIQTWSRNSGAKRGPVVGAFSNIFEVND